MASVYIIFVTILGMLDIFEHLFRLVLNHLCRNTSTRAFITVMMRTLATEPQFFVGESDYILARRESAWALLQPQFLE